MLSLQDLTTIDYFYSTSILGGVLYSSARGCLVALSLDGPYLSLFRWLLCNFRSTPALRPLLPESSCSPWRSRPPLIIWSSSCQVFVAHFHLTRRFPGENLFNVAYGASIYANTDVGTAQGRPWKFLGVLTNEKPSAVFKLSDTHKLVARPTDQDNAIPKLLEIGISIEQLYELDRLMMENSSTALVPAPSSSVDVMALPLVVAQRVGEHLFNYITSFARQANDVATMHPTLPVVPVKVVQDWFDGLIRRASLDPASFIRQFSRPDPA